MQNERKCLTFSLKERRRKYAKGDDFLLYKYNNDKHSNERII